MMIDDGSIRSRLMSGSSAEQRAGREASGVGDEARLAQLVAMEFAEAIDRLLEQLRRRMLDAVGGAELRRIS